MENQGLSLTEVQVKEKFLAGNWADLTGLEDKKVRASVLRHLILCAIQRGGASDVAPPLGFAVRIRGAHIEGPLKLLGLGGTSVQDDLPTLIFEQCHFLHGVGVKSDDSDCSPCLDLSGSTLRRIEIRDCTVCYVAIDAARIKRGIKISGMRAESDGDLCRISARLARCEGAIVIEHTRFRASYPNPYRGLRPDDYAVDFRDAVIDADLIIASEVEAVGGIRFPRHIKGDVWILGVRIEAVVGGQSSAIQAQQSRVDGMLTIGALNQRERTATSIIGGINFSGLVVSGIMFVDVSLGWRALPEDENDRWLLNAGHLKVGNTLTLYLAARGDELADQRSYERAWMAHCQIGGDFHVKSALDSINISQCKILGLVNFEALPERSGGAIFAGLAEFDSGVSLEGIFSTVNLQQSEIGGDVNLRHATADHMLLDSADLLGDVIIPKNIHGLVSLKSARIQGSVVFGEETAIDLDRWNIDASIIDMEDCIVASDLKITEISVVQIRTAFLEVLRTKPEKIVVHKKTVGWAKDVVVYEASLELNVDGDVDKRVRTAAIVARGSGRSREYTFLSGTSFPIHTQNAKLIAAGDFELRTEGQALEYLQYFCAYVWGADGAFAVVTEELFKALRARLPNIDLSKVQIPSRCRKEGEHWIAKVHIWYGDAIFDSELRILESGMVEMLGDTRVVPELPKLIAYQDSLRLSGKIGRQPAVSGLPVYGMLQEWKPIASGKGEWKEVIAAFSKGLSGVWGRVERKKGLIRLEGSECRMLDDDYGRAWKSGVTADFSGFRYRGFDEHAFDKDQDAQDRRENVWADKKLGVTDAFAKTNNATKKITAFSGEKYAEVRLDWLRRLLSHRLYANGRKAGRWSRGRDDIPELIPALEYMHTVFRSKGDNEAASEVLIRKLKHETRGKEWYAKWLRIVFVEWLFQYGFSGKRAFVSFCNVWFFGGMMYAYLSFGSALSVFPNMRVPSLVSDASPDRYLVIDSRVVEEENMRSLMEISGISMHESEIACADQIEPLLYSLDAMLPLLDLQQQSKCQVTDRNTWPAFFWRLFNAVFSLFGTYITSMSLLTFTGILKRSIDRSANGV